MTEIDDSPETPAAPADGRGLEDKMQEYHRRGGPHGGRPAKTVEADIISAGLRANDDLKKGRPPSRPAERD